MKLVQSLEGGERERRERERSFYGCEWSLGF